MYHRKLDIIKQPIPIVLGTFALLVALLTLRAVDAPLLGEVSGGIFSPVGVWFNGLFGEVGYVAFSVVMTMASAVVFTRIISRYSISVIRSFLPLTLYGIMVCGVLFAVCSPALQFSLFLLAHSAELMVGSFKRQSMFDDVMCASFYAGLATLLVPDLVYVSLLVVYQWVLYRRSMRECIAGGILLLLPIVPAEFVGWLMGGSVGDITSGWLEALSPLGNFSWDSLVQACGGVFGTALLVILVLLGAVSVVMFLASYMSMRTRARKIHLYFTIVFLVGVAMLFLGASPVVSIGVLGMGIIPLVHTYFVRRPGVATTLVYILLLALVVVRSLVLMQNILI